MNTAKESTNGPASPNPEAANAASMALVFFRLGEQRYALRLDAVDRVIRAVAVTPVPETPAFVLGLVNLAGQLLPVFSLRRCLGLPDRPIRPEDQFVIARTSRLTVAMVVDEMQGVRTLDVAETVAPR
jgi:purine-binding chemotaxis protein CheW